MTGNLHVLLALAQAIMSLLPTVGSAAARRSKSIARRTWNHGIAVIGRVTSSFRDTRTARLRNHAAGSNAARAGKGLAP